MRLILTLVVALTACSEVVAENETNDWLRFFAGTWQVETGDGTKQTVTWNLAANGQALVGESSGNGARTAELMGWENDKKRLVHMGYGQDGDQYWRTEYVVGDHLKGETKGIMPGGNSYRARAEVVRLNEDAFDVHFALILEGGKLAESKTTFARKRK